MHFIFRLDGDFVSKLQQYSEMGVCRDCNRVMNDKVNMAEDLDKLVAESFTDVIK